MRQMFTAFVAALMLQLPFMATAHAAVIPAPTMVEGTIEATFVSDTVVEGTISGDLEGTITVDLEAGTTTLTVGDGTITTMDRVLIRPEGRDLAVWLGLHVIDEGTGAFENAIGGFRTLGTVDRKTGDVTLEYLGFIFVPE